MLKKPCLRTLKKTRTISVLLFLIALSLAALFFRRKNVPESIESLKPSQLDFSKQNEVLPPVTAPSVPEVTSAPVAANSQALTSSEQATFSVFEEILKSKNDNDPRMDRQLLHFTQALKSALFERYEKIAPENRNGRGLVVFLVARDLNSSDDIEFLKKVYQEHPCMSLEDCKNTGSDDAHYSGLNQTTLNYPQLAGLFQLEKQLGARPSLLNDPEVKSQIQFLLKQAEDFPVPAVADKAREIRKKFGL